MNIEEKSLDGAIISAGSRIGHMHLPDSHRLAPGDGHIDFGAVLAALRRVNFSGYLSFEMFGITPEMMWLPSFELCDDEVRKGIKHIRHVEASLVAPSAQPGTRRNVGDNFWPSARNRLTCAHAWRGNSG